MKYENRNIEEFLKDKLDGFDAGYQSDWSRFEVKLDRAILYYRMKVGALIGVVLILITLGIAGGNGLKNYSKVQATAAGQPSFFHQLRSRTPVLNALRIRAAGIGIGGAAPTGMSTGNGKEQNPASRQTLAINTNEKSDQNEKQTFNKELVKTLELQAKSTGATILSENLTAESGLSFIKPNYRIENLAKHARVNAEVEAGNDRPQTAASQEEYTQEESVELNTRAQLDLDGLKTRTENTTAELGMRPALMPLTFEKRAAYVSPLQAKNPWSYSISVYPNFTFRKFKVDREKLNLIHRDFIDATQEAEKGGFSLNIGLVVSRRIGRITYLNGGVEYINYKTVAEYNFFNYREANINAESNRIENYSILDEPEQIVFSGNNVYHYLNFPFSISHQPWVTDHVRLNIEAGGSFMYFLGADGQAIDYQSLEIIDISEREYSSSIASLHMKVGVCYYVSDRLNFGLEPTMMYFTNTIYSEEYPFQVIPYSVGVNLKLQVKLN